MNSKILRISQVLGAGLLLAGIFLTQAKPVFAQSNATPGIYFKLSESQGIYTIYMKPSTTPASPNATVSAQVTIKVPHGASDPSELTALVAGTSWELTSRNNAPSEAPNSDYLSFSLDFPTGNFRAFNWADTVEQAVFQFKTTTGGHLIDDCDVFAAPNSQDASVGNEITVLGNGGGSNNAYLGTHDQMQDCLTAEQAKSAVKLLAESSASSVVQAGDLVTYTFTINNGGLRSAEGLTLYLSLSGQAETKSASNSFAVANPVLNPNSAATWHLGELDANANGTVQVVLSMPAGNDTLTLQASIAASNDNDSADNSTQLVTQVMAVARSSHYSSYLPMISR